jgi:hypothetical protein
VRAVCSSGQYVKQSGFRSNCSAFYCESLLSLWWSNDSATCTCATSTRKCGNTVLPIADEVQCGFGRLGSPAMWGFKLRCNPDLINLRYKCAVFSYQVCVV